VELKEKVEEPSFLGYTLALTLVSLGATRLMNTDGILAVFVTGVVLDKIVVWSKLTSKKSFHDAISKFFTLPVFALFGATLPWQEWLTLGWSGLIIVAAILLLRRLPTIFLIKPMLKQIGSVNDAVFAGWFGPIGISTLFYVVLAVELTGIQQIWVIGSLIVFSSIIIHGVTSTFLTGIYIRSKQKELVS
jgi:NhaP-type Na+/H+ or K+/H+ antiporter